MERHQKKHPNHFFKKGDFLFMEDDPCHDIILIETGKVKIGHYDDEGNEHVIAFLGKGEILGQMALLGENKHRAFAEAMENKTQICRLSVEKARQLSRDYVPFAIEMNRRIGDHIRKLERRIEILLCKDAKTRLLEFLWDLGENYGRPRDGGIWVSHNLTQTDIGTIIGISRKSVSLLLNELEAENIIQFDRQHFFITSASKQVSQEG